MATKPRLIVRRPPLKPYQLSAFFHDKRYAWIEGSTKGGKTYTGIAWLFEQAVVGSFRNYWWVAPTYKTAKIAYTRMASAIPAALRKLNETDLTITLPNGHVIWFLSAEKPDNLYGEDVGAVVIDEASRIREQSWHAIRSTVTYTRGKVRGIGNVKGRKNWFYKLCRAAEAGMASRDPNTNAYYAKITAADAVREGILPQEEIDDARRVLPEDVFLELYYGIPTEDGSNPFGMKHIAACVGLMSTDPTAAFGIDLAKAIDYTVTTGLDSQGRVSAWDRFQKPWEDTYRLIYEITDPSRAPAMVDSTGVGDPVLERLQKDRPRRFQGYKFTSQSKQKLMEGLAVAIQSKQVMFPDGPIKQELENFEYEYTRTGVRYSAPEGFHDDCVISLALAVAMLTGLEKKKANRVYPNWGAENEL